MKIITFFLLLLAGSSAFGNCPDVRLDINGVMAPFPIFDQATSSATEDANICYAATAAQLFDAYRASHLRSEKLEYASPWWVALNYSSSFKKEDAGLEFGEPDRALEMIREKGICSQEVLFEDRKAEDIVRFYQKLKTFFKANLLNRAEAAESAEAPEKKLEAILKEGNFFKPEVALSEVSARASQERNFLGFLQAIFQEKCRGQVRTDLPFEFQRFDVEKGQISQELGIQLMQKTLMGAQPVEASICSQVFRDPEYKGYRGPGRFKDSCMRHSVLIVGSRNHYGQCQYLIRDTYGAQSCTRTLNGKPWYHPGLDCQGGQVWVPESALLNNLWGLTKIATTSIVADQPTPLLKEKQKAQAATKQREKDLSILQGKKVMAKEVADQKAAEELKQRKIRAAANEAAVKEKINPSKMKDSDSAIQ